MDKIIALDQSTTATGVAIFKGIKLIDYFLIKPKSSKKIKCIEKEYNKTSHVYSVKMPEETYEITLNRITSITDILSEVFKKEKPNKVYFEDVFENSNPKGFKSLSRLQGFIAHLCHINNIPYEIIEESKWITAWGTYSNKIKRTERKADVMNKVNHVYNLDIKINDISDAIGIGKYAVSKNKEDN